MARYDLGSLRAKVVSPARILRRGTWVLQPRDFPMGETDDRTQYEGKGLFIIRNGKKVAKYEAGKWVPLLPGVVVRMTADGIKIEMPH